MQVRKLRVSTNAPSQLGWKPTYGIDPLIEDMIASKLIAKNKSYTSPIIKFLKAGNFTITTYVGSAKKLITVKVSK
jgi:hypothetical protein